MSKISQLQEFVSDLAYSARKTHESVSRMTVVELYLHVRAGVDLKEYGCTLNQLVSVCGKVIEKACACVGGSK